MAFVMVGLGVIGLGCSITAQYFSAKTAMGIGKEIRYDMSDFESTVIAKLYHTLTGIQRGKIKAPEGWIMKIK